MANCSRVWTTCFSHGLGAQAVKGASLAAGGRFCMPSSCTAWFHALRREARASQHQLPKMPHAEEAELSFNSVNLQPSPLGSSRKSSRRCSGINNRLHLGECGGTTWKQAMMAKRNAEKNNFWYDFCSQPFSLTSRRSFAQLLDSY